MMVRPVYAAVIPLAIMLLACGVGVGASDPPSAETRTDEKRVISQSPSNEKKQKKSAKSDSVSRTPKETLEHLTSQIQKAEKTQKRMQSEGDKEGLERIQERLSKLKSRQDNLQQKLAGKSAQPKQDQSRNATFAKVAKDLASLSVRMGKLGNKEAAASLRKMSETIEAESANWVREVGWSEWKGKSAKEDK